MPTPIPNCVGYEIDTNGIVYGIGKGLAKELKPLKGHKDIHGYITVNIRCNGVKRNMKVHRLMLLTFIGPPSEGAITRHLDDNPSNNKLENICWGSYKENYEDALKNNRVVLGDKCKNAKLTDDKVNTIRVLGQKGLSHVDIAKLFRVNQSTVTRIINKKRWKHI